VSKLFNSAVVFIAGVMLISFTSCGDSGGSSSEEPLPQFIVCSSTYALCTTALCAPIAGNDQFVSCNCDVTTGYSAGLTECPGVQQTNDGATVVSRRYPVKTYLRCSNDRPWAMCLDSHCIIDSDNPSQAACKCTVLADQGPQYYC
jgi:hypothetical protein